MLAPTLSLSFSEPYSYPYYQYYNVIEASWSITKWIAFLVRPQLAPSMRVIHQKLGPFSSMQPDKVIISLNFNPIYSSQAKQYCYKHWYATSVIDLKQTHIKISNYCIHYACWFQRTTSRLSVLNRLSWYIIEPTLMGSSIVISTIYRWKCSNELGSLKWNIVLSANEWMRTCAQYYTRCTCSLQQCSIL